MSWEWSVEFTPLWSGEILWRGEKKLMRNREGIFFCRLSVLNTYSTARNCSHSGRRNKWQGDTAVLPFPRLKYIVSFRGFLSLF